MVVEIGGGRRYRYQWSTSMVGWVGFWQRLEGRVEEVLILDRVEYRPLIERYGRVCDGCKRTRSPVIVEGKLEGGKYCTSTLNCLIKR